MKRSAIICVLALTGIAGSLFIVSQSRAQSTNFINVVPFSSPSGRLGFFDQNTGKIFIYDNDARECVFRGQMMELGKPIEHLEKKNGSSSTIPMGNRTPIKIERGIPAQE
jgi:hypothetical protein